MLLKFLLCVTAISLSLIETTTGGKPDNGLQERFSSLLSRKAFVSHSSGDQMSDFVLSELQSVVSVCNSNQMFLNKDKSHNEALLKLKKLLREQWDTESFLRLAGGLRDFPQMNFHMWLAAFLSVSYERDDLVTLQKPHPLALTPEFYLSPEAYEMANFQAQAAPEDRVCIPVDGTLTTETENGREHVLWYFREDLLFGFQHGLWHFVHPFLEAPNATVFVDRRGEAFYYFHRVMCTRYNTERLTMGFDLVKPMVMQDGYVVEDGYFPHLTEMQSAYTFGNRLHNTTTTGASVLEGFMKNVTDDIQQGFLVSDNGTRFSILTSEAIDFLVNNVEAYFPAINDDRYMEYGVHNAGHGVLSGLSVNGSFGIIASGVATRDPLFYRWHQTVDDIFEINKAMLPPYEPTTGELALVWEGVNVTSVEVTSVNLPTNPNILETFMGTQTVDIPYTPDGYPPANNGTLEYCIKRLDHIDFQYKIITARSANSNAVNATVRIFMAPRFSRFGELFSLAEQRRLYFPLDNFQVTLNPGETQIIRNSTQSTLSLPWRLEGSDNPEVEIPTEQRPYCGCGWPHHLLIPRGTPEGMAFDLFVIVTDSTSYETEPEDVCISARILCGVRGGKYPDPYPMGYPFDRTPFNDPETSEVVSSIGKYSQFIPNSKAVVVTIIHRE